MASWRRCGTNRTFLLTELGVRQGGSVAVETTDGRKRVLKVTGVVYDSSQVPTLFSGSLYGYISMDTLEKLDEERRLNQLNFVVQPWVLNGQDKTPVTAVGRQAWTKLEQGGTQVFWMIVTKPGEHPMQDPINAMNMLLAVLGVLSLGLGTFLLVNTVSAILSQQVRQIGMMKAIGGRKGQIMRLIPGAGGRLWDFGLVGGCSTRGAGCQWDNGIYGQGFKF